jgi:predicted Zn-dependent protease
MQFEARRVDDTPNLPNEHPLVEASWLLIGLGVLVAALVAALVFLVELVVAFLPVQTEKDLLSHLAAEYDEEARQSPLLDRPRKIVQRLGRHWPEDPYEHQLFVMKSEGVNAFALPGGAIGITSALLEQTADNEAALAFVLAHELGHFAHRDHLRGMGRGMATSLGLMALGLAGADVTAGRWVSSEMMRHLSVEDEAEADAFAFRVLCQEYQSVDGALDAFQLFPRMKGAAQMLEVLGDHPTTPSRVEAARQYAGSGCNR